MYPVCLTIILQFYLKSNYFFVYIICWLCHNLACLFQTYRYGFIKLKTHQTLFSSLGVTLLLYVQYEIPEPLCATLMLFY